MFDERKEHLIKLYEVKVYYQNQAKNNIPVPKIPEEFEEKESKKPEVGDTRTR